MKMGRGGLVFGLVFGLLLSLSRAHAQDPDQQFFLYNESRQALDEAAIRAAAEPLLEKDVIVIIMLAEQDSIDRLSAYIRRDVQAHRQSHTVYMLISLDPPLRRIGYGQHWVSSFQPHVQNYIHEEMIPAFDEGDYTGAYVRVLERMATDIKTPSATQNLLRLGLAALVIALIFGAFAYLVVQGFRGKLPVEE